jgi:hypothetical protein
MTPKPHSAQAYDAGELDSGPFVINLCSSTTPMALVQPQAPELKRFTFFMSRRREEGRERFRLHMGYFVTAAEADEWLNVVRQIFPGAWVGEAPGKRLRERQAAAKAQAGTPVPAPAVTFAPPPRPPAAPAAVQQRAPTPAARAPVQRQAAPAAQAPVREAPAARVPANVPTVHPARAATPPPPVPPAPPATPASNVREVLAELDRAPARARAVPQNVPVPRAKPAQPNVSKGKAPVRSARPVPPARAAVPARTSTPPRSTPAAPARPRAQAPAAQATASISDTQVLRILEQRAEMPTQDRPHDDAGVAIELLKPDDTGTRRALREAVAENRPIAFAVQLQWSVQPIDLAKVPPLAIFSAYTLYTVEGSREGRKWFGLRLGFFSDAISAKQVAYYVRSEFATVAVIPVSTQERSRATEEKRVSPSLARPIPVKEPSADEFKLLDDDEPPRPRPQPQPQKPAAPAAKARPSGTRAGGRVQARAKARGETLEETLEILGASELEMDPGRGETLNDTGVRHLRVEVKKNTPFGRLLDALTERVKG